MKSTTQNPLRIHIIGAAGSGKTTLARWSAERLDCPWYELDTIAYEGGYGNGKKRTLEDRLISLQEITNQPTWITEGFFIWWIDDLLDTADTIIWLDLPWTISMPRIVARHFRLSWAGENRYPGIWKLTKFCLSWWPYYSGAEPQAPQALDDDFGINRVGVEQYLMPYMDKVIQCRTPADVDKFLKQLYSGEQNNV